MLAASPGVRRFRCFRHNIFAFEAAAARHTTLSPLLMLHCLAAAIAPLLPCHCYYCATDLMLIFFI